MSDEILTRNVPSDYVVMLLIIGSLILFLTPISLRLPWSNPFSEPGPSEALGSIAIIIVFSLFIGFPIFLIRERIIGSGGLNDHLKNLCLRFLKWIKIAKTVEIEPVLKVNRAAPIQNFRFNMWAKREGIAGDLSFFGLKYAMTNAIIIGSEVAAIGNLFVALPLLLVFKGIFIRGIISVLVFFGISFLIWLIMWRLDSSYFKKDYDGQTRAANILYNEWLEKKKPVYSNPRS